jgi:hypothetical protein
MKIFTDCIITGENAENCLFDILLNLNYNPRKANFNENVRKHFDIVYTCRGKEIKVDVKASKKRNRKDDNVDNSIVWIELKNVKGNNGWLHGEADYIAFEQDTHFLFIKRSDLAEFVKTLPLVKGDKKEEYCILTRRGRKDEIFFMPFEKLNDIKNKHILYKNYNSINIPN